MFFRCWHLPSAGVLMKSFGMLQEMVSNINTTQSTLFILDLGKDILCLHNIISLTETET